MNIRIILSSLVLALTTASGALAQTRWVPVAEYQAQLGTSGKMSFTTPDKVKNVVDVVVPPQKDGTVVDGEVILNGKSAHMFARKTDAGIIVFFRVNSDSLRFGDLSFQEWKLDLKTGQTYVLNARQGSEHVEFPGSYKKN